MKKPRCWPALPSLAGVLMLSLALPLPAAAETRTYVLDPAHSLVHFELLHFGTSTVRGRFAGVQGAVTIDAAAQRGDLSLRLPTTSVSTGIPIFDARIRQADLLASVEYPEAYFVATRFTFDGERVLAVRGEFTLRGISQPLNLQALRYGCRRDEAASTEICSGDFEGEFKRSDFGATFGLPFVGDRVRLRVQVEGRR